jgi:tetratricopeptide (TPR) repeat protein
MIALLSPTFVLFTALALAPSEMDPEARQRLTQGLEDYQNKAYAAAIKEFRLAYALDPRAEILFAWAQAERLYGRCSRASKLYRRFLASRPSEQQAEAARQGVERCKGQADTVPADQEEDVPAVPEPVAAEPEPEPVPEDIPPEPPPPPPRRRVDGAGIGLLVGGVVVAGVGGGLLGAGQSKARGLDDAAMYDDYADGAGRVRTLRIAGGVLAGVGGALIVAGIVRLVMKARAPRRDVAVWTNPEGAGIVMRLRF